MASLRLLYILSQIYIGIILLFLCLSNVLGSYDEVYWQAPIRVYEYHAYKNTRLLEFTVPPLTWQATWIFQAYKSDDRCKDRNVTIVTEYGSYPVINPLNETFPKHFNLRRSSTWSVNMTTDSLSMVMHSSLDPLPGSWFSALFINDYVDDKITQKGLSLSCSYYVECTNRVQVLDAVQEVVADVHIPVSMDGTLDQLYRFHTTEQTWQLTLTVFNCSAEVDNDNGTVNNISVNCPLLMSSREMSLPQLTPPSHIINCSGLDPCVSTINSPAANDWHYIRFSSLHHWTIKFMLLISTKECERYQFWTTDVEARRTAADSGADYDGNITVNKTSLRSNASSSSNDSLVTEVTSQRPVITVITNKESSSVASVNVLNKHVNNNTEDSDMIDVARNHTQNDTEDTYTCVRLPELGRLRESSRSFQTQFQLRAGPLLFPNRLRVPDDQAVIMKVALKPVQDSGGTLKFGISLTAPVQNTTDKLVTVDACIQPYSIPINETSVSCQPYNRLQISPTNQSAKVYFPYPEPGSWYLALISTCYNSSLAVVACNESVGVLFEVSLSPCVDGGCGDHGYCQEFYSGVFHYSSCNCIANWRGYGCTDGSVADSVGAQLLAALLLTMSNLAFLPAVVVSLYRRFYVEALVYFFTMFFSTFYHACDGDRANVYCMMPYNVLAQCDFFGAIMSFWVTLVAMSRLTERFRSFLFMLAALGLAIGVTWDRHSLWTFLVPAAVAAIIMLITWGLQCKERRTCYPTWKRWVFFLLPGALIAILGLCIFAFLETESNYQYTHSTWHACMAICIVFLLPPRRLQHKVTLAHGHITESELDVTLMVPADCYALDNPIYTLEQATPPKL